MPDALNNREGLQAREPSKCLNRQSYGERLAKEAFDCQLQEAGKKTLPMHACMLRSLQLCLTLCNPMDCNLPGSSVQGISQAAISFFRGSS